MTPHETHESESLLRRMLAEAGVDEAHSDPAAAWEVFKRYAAIPVNCARDYLLFQVGDGRPESGLSGYLVFTREFEMRGAGGDEPVWFEQTNIEFTVPPPRRQGVGAVTLYSVEFPDDTAFFAAVEATPEFQAGLIYPGFAMSIYYTGV